MLILAIVQTLKTSQGILLFRVFNCYITISIVKMKIN